MHPHPYPSAWICPVIRLWNNPALLKPASLREFTQVWGMWCTSTTPLLLTDLHTFNAFFIRTRLKNLDVPPPPHPPGPALPILRSHLYCCSYAMKPDGRRANQHIVEKSWPNRKKNIDNIRNVTAKCNTWSAGCCHCKKQDFQAQEALHLQTYMKDEVFCRSTNN